MIYGVQWDLVLKFIETKGATTKEDLTSNSKAIGNCKDNLWNITNVNVKYSTNNGNTFNVCPYQKNASEGVLLTTGADTSFSLMNIYDLAGNVWEWTLGKTTSDSTPCALRGGHYGNYGDKHPASYCYNDSTGNNNYGVGFRISLF